MPARPATDLIPVTGRPAPNVQAKKTGTTLQYWLNYYRTHDEEPKNLRDKITLLNFNRKTQDVWAILAGYLTYHSRNAEPWMYEALALSIKMNKGSEKDVKTALGYAADLAERDGNPNFLLSVADLMFVMGYNDRVGKLLDRAIEKVPHRAEPLILSINLAQRVRDPRRMADSIDRLLALGWPGADERIRRDARHQAELLAKTLREEGKDAEASALLARLPEAEARDLFIRLTWTGDADLDLVVEESMGATASYRTPRTVFGGAIVKNGYGTHPEEVYVCPQGFDGPYTIRIETIYNNPDKPALQAKLEIITHEGTSAEHAETRTITLGKTPAPIVVELKGGRRKLALPFVAPTPPDSSDEKEKASSKKAAKRKGQTAARDAGKPAAAVAPPIGQGGIKARPR